MDYILEGIVFGLGLAILMGPILVALLQTSIERGTKAGLTLASGVWTSDFILISLTYFFVNTVNKWVNNADFTFWMSIIGGTILIAFGISIFLSKREKLPGSVIHPSSSNYFAYWLKGFLVNTVNPFSFVFWISVISANIMGRKMDGTESSLFLGAILFTIIFTDTLKVLLAKIIKKKLNTHLINKISQVAGAILAIIGLAWIVMQIGW